MRNTVSKPLRNLLGGIAFVLAVSAAAIAAYMLHGWSFNDALYFTILTVFTVGYGEVRPIDTEALRFVTMSLIVLGCSGTIFVTGALVQFITFNQINEILGGRRMKSQIDELRGHIIICGFGRIGSMLAGELKAGGQRLVILERSEARHAQAQAQGYLSLIGDATEEEALRSAGIDRAHALATVLPDDAANVFITLTARSLNSSMIIIARGEAPATESKLLQAGANRVVLPTAIGAERIAEIIMYPELSKSIRNSEREASASLRKLGLELEMVIAESGSAFADLTVAEIEQQAAHGFLVLAVQAPGAEPVDDLRPQMRVRAGSGVTVIVRSGHEVVLGGFRASV